MIIVKRVFYLLPNTYAVFQIIERPHFFILRRIIVAVKKNILGRIIHKHDTLENWNKATSFIPEKGEIIVYDIDDNFSYERIKVGDGITPVTNLPYYLQSQIDALFAELEKKVEVSLGADAKTLIFS